MKVLLLTNDVKYMSVTSLPFLAMSSMRSIKDCFCLHLQEFVEPLRQRKLPVDPCSKDKHACLDNDSDQDHLDLVNSVLDTDPHWILENNLGM
jgi:hypothetical protein